MPRVGFRDRLAEVFKHRPGIWLDGRELATLAGAYAWRTRLSECRTQLGMTIQNRLRYVKQADGSTFVISEYRYVPPVPREAPKQPDLFSESEKNCVENQL